MTQRNCRLQKAVHESKERSHFVLRVDQWPLMDTFAPTLYLLFYFVSFILAYLDTEHRKNKKSKWDWNKLKNEEKGKGENEREKEQTGVHPIGLDGNVGQKLFAQYLATQGRVSNTRDTKRGPYCIWALPMAILTLRNSLLTFVLCIWLLAAHLTKQSVVAF